RFPEIPLVGFTLIGVVLSIFLGFKNTACYDRWWEARKLWGVLAVITCTFSGCLQMFPPTVAEVNPGVYQLHAQSNAFGSREA
uniref:bestrophin family protein n=1 Tax=Acinetobacter oleivorans TaxID=1148157 RepID=UPI0020907FFE